MLRSNKITKTSVLWLVLVQWVIAYEWLKAGIGKFTDGEYIASIPKTIGAMVQGTSYRWYADLIDSFDAQLLGNLTRLSEVIVGTVILLGGLYILKLTEQPRWLLAGLTVVLFLGAFLNLNFYLAAGWNSQAVVGLNLVMGLTQVVLGSYYLSLFRNK